jgi:hypothetical protein
MGNGLKIAFFNHFARKRLKIGENHTSPNSMNTRQIKNATKHRYDAGNNEKRKDLLFKILTRRIRIGSRKYRIELARALKILTEFHASPRRKFNRSGV